MTDCVEIKVGCKKKSGLSWHEKRVRPLTFMKNVNNADPCRNKLRKQTKTSLRVSEEMQKNRDVQMSPSGSTDFRKKLRKVMRSIND